MTFDRKKKEIILSAIIKKCVFKTEFLKKEKKKFNHHLELVMKR